MTDDSTTSTDGDALMQAVQPLSAEEAVTVALRDAILTGWLSPGERLAQGELAKQLGVSRIPLRDALRRLEEEALVKIDGRRGAWVTALTMQDVAEIYELRIMLEARCVKYAVENLSDEEARHLLELSKHMDTAEQDVVEGRAARRQFYDALYSHANRPRIRRLIMQLRDNVGRYHVIRNSSHSHEEHSVLRGCIKVGDVAGAVEAVTKHLVDARDDLLATMARETGNT